MPLLLMPLLLMIPEEGMAEIMRSKHARELEGLKARVANFLLGRHSVP